MNILLSIITVFAFVKTLSYGLYELKDNNKTGFVLVTIVAIIGLVFPNIVIWFI